MKLRTSKLMALSSVNIYAFSYSETAVNDGNLNAVDVCALLLAANQLFKRKKFGKLATHS